jgi:uncharacterized protein (DUF433 family)
MTMPEKPEMLTLTEAAVIASVSVRDVNRVIDEKLLPKRFYRVRRIHIAACPLVGFYFQAANALTSEERGRLIREISMRIAPKIDKRAAATWRKTSAPSEWTVKDGFLTVSLWDFATSADDREAMLAEAREAVVKDREVLKGTPVMRGTRVPVYDVAASVAKVIPRERIRAAYPSLDDRMIDLATLYAEATPPRGRPRQTLKVPRGAKEISRHKVARRKSA